MDATPNHILLAAALEYGRCHWPIFPLCRRDERGRQVSWHGKEPAIPKPHPKGSPEWRTCKGECGLPGHGVRDATTDLDQITEWWSGRYRNANIGARVPASMFVLDIDPRHGGLDSLTLLQSFYEPLPDTLCTLSGRGDGGSHLFYRRPPGTLSARRLGPGIDLKTSTGYTVVAPSIHPDTGRRYSWIDHPVAAPPTWLVALLLPEPAPRISPQRPGGRRFQGPSIADAYCAGTTWLDVLGPHGWTCPSGDGDADGAIWLHPAHTSACSATIRNGCLFVWSTSTAFDVSEPGRPKGYTKFRAYALLNHGGDLTAAAQHLKGHPC